MEQAGVGRRERRKQETRSALIDAALSLSLTHGADRVTIDMIANVADVSTRTFFNYFGSKEDALVGIEELAVLVPIVSARPAGEEPLVTLRAALQEGGRVIAANPVRWLMRAQVIKATPSLHATLMAAFEPLEQAMVETLTERCAHRSVDRADRAPDLYPSLVCAAALTAGRVAMRRWFESGCTVSLSALVDQAFDLLEGGLHSRLSYPRSDQPPFKL